MDNNILTPVDQESKEETKEKGITLNLGTAVGIGGLAAFGAFTAIKGGINAAKDFRQWRKERKKSKVEEKVKPVTAEEKKEEPKTEPEEKKEEQ